MTSKTQFFQYMNIKDFYIMQTDFQHLIGEKDIPRDDPNMLAHHLLGLITEVGEVAQADKRWKKNKRNMHYDKKEKILELADCFIFLLNCLIYSDISPEEMNEAIHSKINENTKRYLA